MGRETHPRHRSSRNRWLGEFPNSGEFTTGAPTIGWKRAGPATHAQLVRWHAGRGGVLRRLSRTAERGVTQPSGAGIAACSYCHQSVARPCSRVLLRSRSPASPRQILCYLSRRQPDGAPDPQGRNQPNRLVKPARRALGRWWKIHRILLSTPASCPPSGD